MDDGSCMSACNQVGAEIRGTGRFTLRIAYWWWDRCVVSMEPSWVVCFWDNGKQVDSGIAFHGGLEALNGLDI